MIKRCLRGSWVLAASQDLDKAFAEGKSIEILRTASLPRLFSCKSIGTCVTGEHYRSLCIKMSYRNSMFWDLVRLIFNALKKPNLFVLIVSILGECLHVKENIIVYSKQLWRVFFNICFKTGKDSHIKSIFRVSREKCMLDTSFSALNKKIKDVWIKLICSYGIRLSQ